MERLVATLTTEARVDVLVRLNVARVALREGVSELATLRLTKESIDEWSRRVFRSFSDAYFELIGVLASDASIDAARADIEVQRADLRAFLSPHRVAFQADWSLVATQLAFDALKPFIRNVKLPTRAEFDAALSSVDFAGPYGASLRVMCFLTHVLDAARNGERASERHLALVGLAFLDAVTMVTSLSRELGASLDPTPYLVESRDTAARDALLRLLALPRDDAFNAAIAVNQPDH